VKSKPISSRLAAGNLHLKTMLATREFIIMMAGSGFATPVGMQSGKVKSYPNERFTKIANFLNLGNPVISERFKYKHIH